MDYVVVPLHYKYCHCDMLQLHCVTQYCQCAKPVRQKIQHDTVPSRSARVASRNLWQSNRRAASSHCCRRRGYSLALNSCRTLELVISTATSGLLRGTSSPLNDLQYQRGLQPDHKTHTFNITLAEQVIILCVLNSYNGNNTYCSHVHLSKQISIRLVDKGWKSTVLIEALKS